MAGNQAETFPFIYLADSNWRTRARSHLTRKQREAKRKEPQGTARSRAQLRSGCPIIAPRDDQEDVPGEVHPTEQLTLAKSESLWSLLDPCDANAPNILPNGTLGVFERITMNHCKVINRLILLSRR